MEWSARAAARPRDRFSAGPPRCPIPPSEPLRSSAGRFLLGCPRDRLMDGVAAVDCRSSSAGWGCDAQPFNTFVAKYHVKECNIVCEDFPHSR